MTRLLLLLGLVGLTLHAACAEGLGADDHLPPPDDRAPDVDLGSWDDDATTLEAAVVIWPGADVGADAGAPPLDGDGGIEASLPEADASDGQTCAGAPRGPPGGSCVDPLGPRVLAIDELMIASVAGAGDYGEWLEVASTSDCAVNLRGLHGDTPVGTTVHSFDIATDVWLLPHGTFVVADSSSKVVNHDLPGPIVTWTGEPRDVLRNLGGTVTLTAGGALVDSVTYPRLKTRVGVSMAFPADCPPSSRLDFTKWQPSVHAWFPGFAGTPNAPNDDVVCP